LGPVDVLASYSFPTPTLFRSGNLERGLLAGRLLVECGDLEGLGVQGPAELGQLEGHLTGRRKRGHAAPPPPRMIRSPPGVGSGADRKSTRLNSSHVKTSYAAL